ncbi:RNase MRP subunit [Neocucurbitaria cava]|uniref:RNase MRP subunit n=1 Tax=Neocucurbitaria cava TaxID=798079 RepID=A0A9W9CKB0_9PLEO|nr:RNase MRP subunit [Neocucurbitaria cava]
MPSASPAITATTLLAASQHEKAMLHDIYELLDKLFARNRNQHRRSHWWKSLHAFRKQTGLLLQEMESKKSEREAKLEARLRYWDEGCIHQWYYQFSQLVAVGPFAMLGLVMMASVARICRISGITAVYEEIASGDVQGVLSANGELALAAGFSGVLDAEEEWDEGVVVQREE